MTRRILATVMALGALITVLSFGGIYAVFTDRATTGPSTVDSAPLPAGVDIELASTDTVGDCAAQDYRDDLTTDVIQASDVKPGDNLGTYYFCVKNVGLGNVTLTWANIDLVETDQACTGEEATVDETCGNDDTGELGAAIVVRGQTYVCATGAPLDNNGGIVEFNGFIAMVVAADPLAPDETSCIAFTVRYPDYDEGTSVTLAQWAQSDTVSWRWAFDATETP